MSAKQLKRKLLSVGKLELVKCLETSHFSAGGEMGENSGNLHLLWPCLEPVIPWRNHFIYLHLRFSLYKMKGLGLFSSRFLLTLNFRNSTEVKIWFVAVNYSRGFRWRQGHAHIIFYFNSNNQAAGTHDILFVELGTEWLMFLQLKLHCSFHSLFSCLLAVSAL